MHYFYLINADSFHQQLLPALTVCFRQRSFRPAQTLCHQLMGRASALNRESGTDAVQPLVLAVPRDLTYSRDAWRLLVAELLLLSAAELPELEIPLVTYAHLVDQPLADRRQDFSPIQQAVLGSAGLSFGGASYHPSSAGFNDFADVQRLSGFLAAVDPSRWLTVLSPAGWSGDWDDEVAFAREWFPCLVEMYRRASCQHQVIICEQI